MASRSDTALLSLSAALIGVVGEAGPTGLLIPSAAAQLAQPPLKRKDDEQDQTALLAIPSRDEHPMMLAAHRSHRSHSSHRSHYSGSGRSRSYWGSSYDSSPAPAPKPVPPPKPKPATVAFVAYPGGRIFVDDKAVGVDESRLMTLPAGEHTVRIENRFVGDTTVVVTLQEGQTGLVEIKW